MDFASLFFLYVFLPVCFLFYWMSRKNQYRNIVLILFSLIFYAWGKPVWVLLLLFVSVFNYIIGRLIHKYADRPPAKIAVIISIILNLSLLSVYKYSAFLITNINSVFSLDISIPSIALPIGISFYIFKAISYTLDCYWDKVDVQKNYLNFLLYISLFPQLLAGPIVRYGTIASDITERKITLSDLDYGITRIIIGLSKKVIIANNLAIIVNDMFSGNINQLSFVGTLYAVIAFALQVYFDFSGYSDIAIGISRLFGFKSEENFKHPFICKDISEFWQRWHITLGTFFRDYLFMVPIFGKRRIYLNLFLVWFCTGLWHGANWNFIIWGLYFGIFIFIEMRIGKKCMKKIPVVIRHIYSKIIIILGFGIFYFQNTAQLLDFFKNLIFLNNNILLDDITLIYILNNIFLLIIAIVLCFPLKKLTDKATLKLPALQHTFNISKLVLVGGLLILCSIMLVNDTNTPFLYFQF